MNALVIGAIVLSGSVANGLSNAQGHANPHCTAPVFADARSGMKTLPRVIDSRIKNLQPILTYEIEPDGIVRNVKVVTSTGSKTFDAKIVKGIEVWRFKPQGCAANMNVGLTLILR